MRSIFCKKQSELQGISDKVFSRIFLKLILADFFSNRESLSFLKMDEFGARILDHSQVDARCTNRD